MKKKTEIDLRFPRSAQKRVAELLNISMGVITSGKIKAQPNADKVIHDILSDFYGNNRVFDVYKPEEDFKERLEELKHMSYDELIREINMLMQGHDVVTML